MRRTRHLASALAGAAVLSGCAPSTPASDPQPDRLEISLHARRDEETSRFFVLSSAGELAVGIGLAGRYAVATPACRITEAEARALRTQIRDAGLLDARGRLFAADWDSVRFDCRVRVGNRTNHVVARDGDLPALPELEEALARIRIDHHVRPLLGAAADST